MELFIGAVKYYSSVSSGLITSSSGNQTAPVNPDGSGGTPAGTPAGQPSGDGAAPSPPAPAGK